MQFLVTFSLTQRWVYDNGLTNNVKVVYFCRQYKITITNPDYYDFKKVISKVMASCPSSELVQGNVSQQDFRNLQVEHIKTWHTKAYTRKYPVINLGLQVNFGDTGCVVS